MIRLVLIYYHAAYPRSTPVRKPSWLRFEPSLLMSMRYDKDEVNLRQSRQERGASEGCVCHPRPLEVLHEEEDVVILSRASDCRPHPLPVPRRAGVDAVHCGVSFPLQTSYPYPRHRRGANAAPSRSHDHLSSLSLTLRPAWRSRKRLVRLVLYARSTGFRVIKMRFFGSDPRSNELVQWASSEVIRQRSFLPQRGYGQ